MNATVENTTEVPPNTADDEFEEEEPALHGKIYAIGGQGECKYPRNQLSYHGVGGTTTYYQCDVCDAVVLNQR